MKKKFLIYQALFAFIVCSTILASYVGFSFLPQRASYIFIILATIPIYILMQFYVEGPYNHQRHLMGLAVPLAMALNFNLNYFLPVHTLETDVMVTEKTSNENWLYSKFANDETGTHMHYNVLFPTPNNTDKTKEIQSSKTTGNLQYSFEFSLMADSHQKICIQVPKEIWDRVKIGETKMRVKIRTGLTGVKFGDFIALDQ
jgi:hypothetical protein